MTGNPLLVDFDLPLRTPRLLLRPPQPGDGAAHCEALAETQPVLRRFLGHLPWVAAEASPAASEAWCRKAQSNFLARTDLPFLMFEHDGRYVGTIGLHRPDWTVPKMDIGYWCRTSRGGHGLVAEGVEAVLGFAFGTLKAARIEAITDEGNTASRRVAERAGFTLEGILRNDHRAPDGSLRSTCMYARLA